MSRETNIDNFIGLICSDIKELVRVTVISKFNLSKGELDSIMQNIHNISLSMENHFSGLIKEISDVEQQFVHANDRINKITRRLIKLEDNPVTGKEQPNEERLFNQIKKNQEKQ